jgi:hypothetical protein
MSRFKFRLARIERVRTIEEEIARGRYAEAELAARAAEDLAQRCADALTECDEHARRLQGQLQLAPHEMLRTIVAAGEARERTRRARDRAATLRYQAGLVRASWLERRKDARALERLEERHREIHEIGEQRADTESMNAAALERAGRRARLEDENTRS